MSTDTSFADWLQAALDERNMKPADLSNQAGLGRGTLSDIFSGRRKPGTELATAIADALNIPQEEVFRAAGILRPNKKINETVAQIVHEVTQRPPEEQQEFLSYIRWRINQRKKK